MQQSFDDLSFWHSTLPGEWQPQERLDGDLDVDVAISGAGYTGLWTAYYLLRERPDLRIAIAERFVVGFGASGRNGGWASAIFPASLHCMAKRSSREAARSMQIEMNATVRELANVIAEERIDCDFEQNGYVAMARNSAQVQNARAEIAEWQSWGFGDDQIRWLDADEMAQHITATRVLGGTYTPHCAVIHPAKLVAGLGRAVRARGARILEDTLVTAIEPGRLVTNRGVVRARHVIRALEGYTATLPQARRDLVPIYSLMLATAPLSEAQIAATGLRKRIAFTDERHLRIYGQLTADSRLAFGGRGAPYHFGSDIKPAFDRDPRVHRMLQDILADLFPALSDVEYTHFWGGALGIPRDWYPSLHYDRSTGVGTAGGYVGDGVATSNLAGRTMADEILGQQTSRTGLPWVGRTSRRWEPEPFRWLGVNAVTQLFAYSDRRETVTGRPSALASGFWKVIGH